MMTVFVFALYNSLGHTLLNNPSAQQLQDKLLVIDGKSGQILNA